MKKVLIISPYFPPTNAADMQRVRMSLSYFKEFGWEPEVVAVHLHHSDMATDDLLKESIPSDVSLHYVEAFPKKWTSKLGLGSIALRSLWFYKRKVDKLLKAKKFDLIYFSTTQFPVCILGKHWKQRFGVPYVIDMQDPWHSEYYEENPQEERPAKYWFAYRLGKILEAIAMSQVDGLIAVSEGYLQVLAKRYPRCGRIPQATITFGAFETDFKIAGRSKDRQPSILPQRENIVNVVYVGRGGRDMQEAARKLFQTFKTGLACEAHLFERFHFYFIGTSYASAGKGTPTISPIAKDLDVERYVTEITDRIPFYQTLNTLSDASALFIPGSSDPQYTASKIYPYVLAKKPLLAFFHPASTVVSFLNACGVGTVLTFDEEPNVITEKMLQFLRDVALNKIGDVTPNEAVIDDYSARTMTKKQCDLFNEVVA